MRIVSPVMISEIREHEAATSANVALGTYHRCECCPMDGFNDYLVLLDQVNGGRIFLLPDFATHAFGQTYRLQDVLLGAAALARVAQFTSKSIDLLSASKLELLIVTPDINLASLVLVDGNHRAIAHYLTHRGRHNVPAYVSVHRNIGKSSYITRAGRTRVGIFPDAGGIASAFVIGGRSW